ncbi:NADP-dependent alcohol dehydrogenase C 2 [Corynebacterium comes]|uniref:alcohol dehydrogenase (NADP(+)) n=1 Tax=Corynebacterium comes TaxID=2675218 RepID=A0A6B8VQ07_9CORY|nr:NADP-dependent alcohol dehydrogenase C 2 [Corynebacterium comes]
MVDRVPAGRVASYGDIAVLAGTGPRQVGRIMAGYGHLTCWWRVVRADGTSAVADRAAAYWDEEGIPYRDGRVSMRTCRWSNYPGRMTELTVRAWGTPGFAAPLEPVTVTRRELREDDVRIRIEFAGICHSDIHTMRGDWGERAYPLVPGHEIVGIVEAVGPAVTTFREGERVGVGCFVNSCGECDACLAGEISYCDEGPTPTYGGFDGEELTQGGYSQAIVVRESFVVSVPEGLDPAATAPLLCAGITTYSPLRRWGAGPGKRVGVIGMGGLGHVGVKIAAAMGAEVTVFSHSTAKRDDALSFGATRHVSTADGLPEDLRRHFDIILNTVSVDLDTAAYLGLLRFDGALVQLGLPGEPLQAPARMFTQQRRSLSGSLVGGIRETQEMLDFCATHDITAEIELIGAEHINEAYDRTIASDVRYRFVIDATTF